MLQIGHEKFLLLVKLKIQFRGLAKLLEVFMKMNCKELVKENLD